MYLAAKFSLLYLRISIAKGVSVRPVFCGRISQIG
jgi:hypothetical protein